MSNTIRFLSIGNDEYILNQKLPKELWFKIKPYFEYYDYQNHPYKGWIIDDPDVFERGKLQRIIEKEGYKPVIEKQNPKFDFDYDIKKIKNLDKLTETKKIGGDEKLIRNGIKYNDQLFDTILKRIEPHVYDSETYEEFLEKTAPFTVQNPLLTLGADEHAINSALLSIAGNKYSYEANRKLTEQAIQDTTAQLVTNVGEDVKQTIRDTMQKGFKENKLRQDIMKDLTQNVEAINNTRAKVIYRTEIKRAQTVSNYISAKERGANSFYCNCNDPCPICDEQYDGGGRDSIIYSMDEINMLPPVHPNCRCVAVFIKDDSIGDESTDEEI